MIRVYAINITRKKNDQFIELRKLFYKLGAYLFIQNVFRLSFIMHKCLDFVN